MTYYVVDGSEDCFYTAVFEAYREKECIITSSRFIQLELDSKTVEITADGEKAERVKNKLEKLDRGAAEDINLALRSNDAAKETVAFEYIKLIIEHGGAVRDMLAHPTVIEMAQIRSRVVNEAHKLKGFLRFMENAEGVLYAPYSPDNDITDILARHFAARFKNQRWVIHDLSRKIAAMFDGGEIVMTSVGDAEVYLSEYEKYFEDLWRRYYKSVNIAQRPHEKQMKGYMPVRYWKYLPEKR